MDDPPPSSYSSSASSLSLSSPVSWLLCLLRPVQKSFECVLGGGLYVWLFSFRCDSSSVIIFVFRFSFVGSSRVIFPSRSSIRNKLNRILTKTKKNLLSISSFFKYSALTLFRKVALWMGDSLSLLLLTLSFIHFAFFKWFLSAKDRLYCNEWTVVSSDWRWIMPETLLFQMNSDDADKWFRWKEIFLPVEQYRRPI